jgi:hypothetical protein
MSDVVFVPLLSEATVSPPLQPHPFEEGVESGVPTQVVVNRADFGKDKPGIALVVGAVEPVERLFAIANRA